ncbi:M20/M25/M40 family metallo-hydrolase, partial [Bacteroidota bacterium]
MNYNKIIKIVVLGLFMNPFLCYAQNVTDVKKHVLKEVEGLKENIHLICQKLWDYSEIALKEEKSAELLIDNLKDEDFVIEKGVAGMPTAFVATYGSGKPVIGILAEYDALPGVGNNVVPYREPRNDGNRNGQGCGHNLFGSACVNAAIAVKRMMVQYNIKGTVKLYGTPAEETVVGKVYMAKAGLF